MITSHLARESHGIIISGLIPWRRSRTTLQRQQEIRKTALSFSSPRSLPVNAQMSSEMGLDSVDPLNLLLQNGDSSSDEASNSQDWSKFSTLWADSAEAVKPYSDMMDFADIGSLPMDMDFNPSIEPSALHYDPLKYNFSYDDQFNALSSELLATQFPFAFQAGLAAGDFSGSSSDSSQSFTKERRLSITSSSSSSGASLSPVPESAQSPAASDIQPKEEPAPDPAAALAQRVRQSAGVMLAVPMNAQLQGTGIHIPGMWQPLLSVLG